MTKLSARRTPALLGGSHSARFWRRSCRYDFLNCVNDGLAISVSKVPTSFFVEIANGVDETVMGSIADLLESAIQHGVRTAKIPDARLSRIDLAGVPPPVIEPLLKGIIIFVRNVILYLRPAKLSLWSRIRSLKYSLELFRIAEITANAGWPW